MSEVLARVRYLRAPYGSRPWSAELDGQPLSGLPVRIDHPDLGPTVIMGPRYWRTKREAVAAVKALMADLESRACR